MKIIRAVALSACLALPACYDFDFPLDPTPVTPVDARLLGAWNCLASAAEEGDAPGTLRIERRSETTMRWTFSSSATDGSSEKSEYDVYGSSVAGGPFLNAKELGAKANGKWNLVRYSFLLPDALRIQVVNDEVVGQPKDAASLRRVIETRAADFEIYIDLLLCARAKAARTSTPF